MSTEKKIQAKAVIEKMNAAIPVFDENVDTLGAGDEREVFFDATVPTAEGSEVQRVTARFTRPPVVNDYGLTKHPVLMSFELGYDDLRAVIQEGGEASIWSPSFSTTTPQYTFVMQSVNGKPVWFPKTQWTEVPADMVVSCAPIYLNHLLGFILVGVENVVSRLYPDIGQERFLLDLLGHETGNSIDYSQFKATPEAHQAYYEVFTEFERYRSAEGQAELSDPVKLEEAWNGWVARLKPHFPTLDDLTQGTASIEA